VYSSQSNEEYDIPFKKKQKQKKISKNKIEIGYDMPTHIKVNTKLS